MPYTEGPKLAAALEQHVKEYDVDVMNLQRADAARAGRRAGRPRSTVELESGAVAAGPLGRAVAPAPAGAQMNVPGEDEYRNKGVTYCPHCDGPLFKGKRVAVIGGGNSGVEAAIDLAGVVAHVTLIEFDGQLRADDVLQRKLRSLPNVDVDRQRADHRGPRRRRARSPASPTRTAPPASAHRVDLDGVFVQIGLLPNTEWLEGTRRAVAPRRDRDRRPRPDLGARRVRRRRLHDGAVQADRDRHGRRLDRRAQRLRPPHPHLGSGRAREARRLTAVGVASPTGPCGHRPGRGRAEAHR